MKTLDEIRNLIAPVLELYHVKSAYLLALMLVVRLQKLVM